MIARYSRAEMAGIWSERNKYLTWLKVETAVCEELCRIKLIPSSDRKKLIQALQKLIKNGGVDPVRVDTHEAVTRHDIIAFTTAVAEEIGPISRYVHFGLTSSDVVDTALSVLVQEAGQILLQDIDELIVVLKKKAKQYRKLPTIGRSHGIFAEPTVFGLKFLGWMVEWERNRERLERSLEQMRFGKLSGAVGVNAHWGPDFEERVLKRLGLQRESVSTQVVPRDRHAEFLQALAICGCSMERITVELRHLQRSEVNEVHEGFQKGQKGSSAMPHKRNPISSENLSGAARMLRGYAQMALENIALWHERDISHSSVERVVFPDAAILMDYSLQRLKRVLEGLEVSQKQVQTNLNKAGKTVFSGHVLLELVKKGVTREDAYKWVQECALASFDGERDFLSLLEGHAEIQKKLKPKQLRELCSIQYQIRNSKEIYRRNGIN